MFKGHSSFFGFHFLFFFPPLCSFIHISTPYSHKPNPPLMKLKKKNNTPPPLSPLLHTHTHLDRSCTQSYIISKTNTEELSLFSVVSWTWACYTHAQKSHTPSTDVWLNFVTRSQSFLLLRAPGTRSDSTSFCVNEHVKAPFARWARILLLLKAGSGDEGNLMAPGSLSPFTLYLNFFPP